MSHQPLPPSTGSKQTIRIKAHQLIGKLRAAGIQIAILRPEDYEKSIDISVSCFEPTFTLTSTPKAT